MNAIIVTRHIDSAHLELPELLAFVGKDVEIRIVERPPMPEGTPERWRPLWELAGRGVIDEEAIREFRAIDLTDSERDFVAPPQATLVSPTRERGSNDGGQG